MSFNEYSQKASEKIPSRNVFKNEKLREYAIDNISNQAAQIFPLITKEGRTREIDVNNLEARGGLNNNDINESYRVSEIQPIRAQKDYIIRHNKAATPSFKYKGNEGLSLTEYFQSTHEKMFDKTTEELDLEDTLPFDQYVTVTKEKDTTISRTQKFSRLWEQALKDLERNDFENAFEKVLNSGNFSLERAK